MTSEAKNYFEAQASRYAERSASLLWRRQRSREIASVFSLLGTVDGEDILDLGCGAGLYTRQCLMRGARKVIAVDFAVNMIAELPRENVVAITADATNLNLAAPVPKIVSAGLLEFTVDPKAVLVNARRLISPEGIMVCLVPSNNIAGRIYRMFHKRNGINISLFSRSSFIRMAAEAGWRAHVGNLVFPFSMVYLLNPVEPV